MLENVLININLFFVDSKVRKKKVVHSRRSSVRKKVPVSSSFGYLIMDSVVAPHDKIDVSRQLIKTVEFSLRDVYGSIINLHGAAISFSLVFVSTD